MVLNGIDRLPIEDFGLKGKRLGLITSPSGVGKGLDSTIDILHRHFTLTALFSPEHGVRGNIDAGGHVDTYTDERTGLPVYSLYGGDNRPQLAMLEGVDAVAIDVQDIGSRYYTYISTMRNTMEECARAGKTFVVLDRVNPIGTTVEGNRLDMAFASFVGIAPIPQRHGLTMGELARLFNAEYGIGCEVLVVPVSGWQRSRYFNETGLPWVNPSPNIPGVGTALLYPGTCLFEGTNLSEGRGTTRPFEYIGAPWLDAEALAGHMNGLKLDGVHFRPVYFQPSASKHQGELCCGVQLHVTNRQGLRPLWVGLNLLKTVADMGGRHFAWTQPNREKGNFFIDLLAGTDALRQALDIEAYYAACRWDSAAFEAERAPYLLYA